MQEKAVVLDNVVKRFGDMVAVNGVSLDVAPGEFVAFIGPSGCGKTTTMRLIAGLDAPSAGNVYINGERVNDVKPWKRETPLVWQNFALFPYLNVAKNVEFGLRMKKVDKAERRKRVARALQMVGISELADRQISQLSGGQKQRVALARGLVLDPKVLLLDEPLGSLDAHLRIRMQSELRALQQELGITFVYVTHNQSEALAMADRVVVMNEGEVQQVGPPREVYREPANRFVAEFVGTNNIFSGEVQQVEEGHADVVTSAGTFEVPVTGARRPAAGERMTFVIAADRITTSFEGEPRGNQVTGVLRGQEFVGSVVTLFLELPDGSEFRIQKQEHESVKITTQLGERLAVSWDARDAYVLADA
jgi:spermidine/putrescine transport system ATP-binding protein